MKKLNLDALKVQSFMTSAENQELKANKGGGVSEATNCFDSPYNCSAGNTFCGTCDPTPTNNCGTNNCPTQGFECTRQIITCYEPC